MTGVTCHICDRVTAGRTLCPACLDHCGSVFEARAALFASWAHARIDQRRKYTNVPYIQHPAAVAELVREIPGATREMLAAAWLHDTVEDTGVRNEDIANEFGSVVASYVGWLTDISKPEDGDRAARKAIDREHSARAPGPVQSIKLADVTDNSRTIVKYDPDFARVYIPEKAALVEVLKNGDAQLWWKARATIELACTKLGLPIPQGGLLRGRRGRR